MRDASELKEQLKMRELLTYLGEDYGDDERGWYNAKRRLVSRLRSMEESTGKTILQGGGSTGSDLWTTKSALRDVWPHLFPDDGSVSREVREVAEEIVARFEDRISEAYERIDVLAGELRKVKQELAQLKKAR